MRQIANINPPRLFHYFFYYISFMKKVKRTARGGNFSTRLTIPDIRESELLLLKRKFEKKGFKFDYISLIGTHNLYNIWIDWSKK